MKPGDRVMMADVTEKSIPAYRDMRGTVVESRIDARGDTIAVRVAWDYNRDRGEPFFRDARTVKVVEE